MKSRRGLVTSLTLALTLAACSSASPTTHAARSATSPAATAPASCTAKAGLTGPIQDHGAGSVQNGAVTLELGDTFFSPTCVQGIGQVRITAKNTGGALHNFSITRLKIDKDLAPGASLTIVVAIPATGSLAFFCKYHLGAGMQGAFIAG